MKNEKVSGWKKSTLAAFIVVGIISFLPGCAGRREAAPTQKKEDTDTSYAHNLESEAENLMFKECQVACMSGKGYGIDYICWNDFLVVTDTVYKRVNGEYWKEEMSVEEMLQNLFGFWNYDTKQYKNYLITVDNDRLNFYIYDMESQKLLIYPGAVNQSIGFLWQVRDGQIYYRSNGAIYCINILNGENRMVYEYGANATWFLVREDGSMVLEIYESGIREYRLLQYDEQGQIFATVILRTAEYEYDWWHKFNQYGLFMTGTFHDFQGLNSEETVVIKDHGEKEVLPSNIQFILEEGYFVWENPENLEILLYYDFVGNLKEMYTVLY